ncbi:MAG: hypothetical protein PVG42_04995 [Lysobacterales bacterium]|jgi:hypothetical protein
MTLLQLHFFAVSFWFGLLAAESVLELVGWHGVELIIARVHRWIDLLCEGPAVITIFVTGGLLLTRVWPAPPLLLVKIVLGSIVLLVNLYCVGLVFARAAEQDTTRFRRLTQKVRMTGYAIPLGLIAFVIGLSRQGSA